MWKYKDKAFKLVLLTMAGTNSFRPSTRERLHRCGTSPSTSGSSSRSSLESALHRWYLISKHCSFNSSWKLSNTTSLDASILETSWTISVSLAYAMIDKLNSFWDETWRQTDGQRLMYDYTNFQGDCLPKSFTILATRTSVAYDLQLKGKRPFVKNSCPN